MKKSLLKVNLQHFATAMTNNELMDYQNRLLELREQKKEIYKKGKASEDVAELRQLTLQADEINDEIDEIEEKIKGQEFRGSSLNPLKSYNLSGNGEPTGRDSLEIFANGETVLTRSQNLSDLYPNTDNLSIGKYLRGAITGKWNDAEKEQEEFRALSTATSNVLIPQVLSSRVIDLARNQSVLFKAGAPLLPMESNNMTISRIKSDPDFEFKKEGQATAESTMEFEPVNLKARTVYGLMSITLEALESSANLEQIVIQSMSESVARTIDKACLYGDGEAEPAGILNNDDINTVPETEALTGYTPFIKAVGKVRRANGNPTAMVINAATDEHLNLLVDNNGNPLATPKVVEDLNRLISNQLPDNEGTNSDESTSMVYDPNSVLIGMQSPIRIEVSREAQDAFEKGLVYLRVYAMLDIAVLKPKHITKITGLKKQ